MVEEPEVVADFQQIIQPDGRILFRKKSLVFKYHFRLVRTDLAALYPVGIICKICLGPMIDISFLVCVHLPQQF